jgi:hypothetical protein
VGATKLAPRRLKPGEEAGRFLPPGGCAFPFVAFVPVPTAPVAPGAPEGASATGEAPLAVAATGPQAAPEEKVGPEVAAAQRHDEKEQKEATEAGGQVAGDEEAKRQEARKKEEGGQSAGAEAPAAGAALAGAAVWPQGGEGTRVRQPDRQPGESGDTPDAKGPRSGEPVPVSPLHWQWKGHTGPAEGPEWSIAGKRNIRGIKPAIC